MKIRFFSMLCALVLGATSAQAVVIVETTDFNNASSFFPFASNIGTLDVGSNSVSGTLAGTCEPFDCNPASGVAQDNQDSFLFTIDAGAKLVTGNILASFVTSIPFMTYSISIRSMVSTIFQENYAVGTGGDFLVSVPDGIEAGTYSLSVFGQSGGPLAGTYALEYDLSLGVAAVSVPMPAGLPLVLSGLVCLGVMFRVRKKG